MHLFTFALSLKTAAFQEQHGETVLRKLSSFRSAVGCNVEGPSAACWFCTTWGLHGWV